jgi:hypothetical protein
LIFESNSDTMLASKALRHANVPARIIIKPAQVQGAANLSLSVDAVVQPTVVELLNAAHVAVTYLAA